MKIWGVTGWKNTGKTGLVERLVTEFAGRGLTVSTIKHAHKAADIDHPGTDSFRHRDAGASEVVLATPHRFAIMHELRGAPEATLDDLLARLAPVDLVLVEGFKTSPHPKIECWRSAAKDKPRGTSDPSIKAMAIDGVVLTDLPCFDLDDTAEIANFIEREVGV